MRVSTAASVSGLLDNLLASGPFLILAVWWLAGQWTLAGPEVRAWLGLAGAVSLSCVVPLPGCPWSLPQIRRSLNLAAWIIVTGLLVLS
jgi:hypothetical protein